jgi:hypothetical protein
MLERLDKGKWVKIQVREREGSRIPSDASCSHYVAGRSNLLYILGGSVRVEGCLPQLDYEVTKALRSLHDLH